MADGTLSLDTETCQFIRDELGFRWVEAESGKHALAIEKAIQRGVLSAGKPVLNPMNERTT